MDQLKIANQPEFLDQLHQLIDQHIQEAVSTYQNLSEAELTKSATDGGWSIAACLEHLNSYHRFYLPLLERAITRKYDKTTQMVKRGWLGDYFIKMMDPERKAVKYKAMKKHLPQPNVDAFHVVAEFITLQEQLIRLLTGAAQVNLNTTYIPTSISKLIRLRLGDTLAFLVTHDERHIRQANKNLL